jgi:hypothetical protein
MRLIPTSRAWRRHRGGAWFCDITEGTYRIWEEYLPTGSLFCVGFRIYRGIR